MKIIIISLSLLLGICATAQTKVVKRNAVKANDYGVSYHLPKTFLVTHVSYTKWTHQTGPYYQYAEQYLGTTDVVLDNEVFYKLDSVDVYDKGEADTDNSYTVTFKAGTVAPYVFLTEDGLLCSINAPVDESEINKEEHKRTKKAPAASNNQSVLSEELLMAGSIAKQAEVAAKQIYRIRESRLNILTGEADNIPPDGESMKLVIEQLEEQERILTNLFVGTKVQESQEMEITIVPTEDLFEHVLFRFSKKLGVVDDDDLAGDPIYFDLRITEKAPILSAEELKKKAKAMKGIVYNIPGKATATIYDANEVLNEEEFLITQFGTQEALAPQIFEDKKMPVKVLFYPESGAIKQIIQ